MEIYEERDNKDECKEKICAETSAIQEFYANKTIFITGASGLLGTLVLEKLIRSCRDVRRIYVLFRSTRRKHVQERVKEYLEDPVFERMKREHPGYASKVTFLEGDLCRENLGLSTADVQSLVASTQVILHVAATVKFDESLADAYSINVAGSKTVIGLAQQMRRLQAFVYVSTAYSNCDRAHIGETFYEPVFTDEETLCILQHSDPREQAILTPLVLGNKPNTYIFSKSVCEDLVRKTSQHLPLVVVRPSIVMPTLKDPVPYWTTRNNSILNMMAGTALGLIRVVYYGETTEVNLVPGDLTANLILAAGWRKAEAPASPTVYNCVTGRGNNITIKMLTNETNRHHNEAKEQVEKVLWQTLMIEVQNTYLLFFLYYVLHVLPGFCISLIERSKNRKPMIMQIHRKFFFLYRITEYFSFNEWTFDDANSKALLSRLNARDRQLFDFDMDAVDWISFTNVLHRCIFKYIIKDFSMFPKDVYKRKMRFIEPMDKAMVWGFYTGAAYFVLKILGICLSYVFNYV